MPTLARPPFDPELQAALDLMPASPPLSADVLPLIRATPISAPIETILEGRDVEFVDHRVHGHGGDEITVSVLKRKDHSGTSGPGVYNIHGGGMIMGDRFLGAEFVIDWVEQYDAVAATVEYRLAPEFQDPVPVEDCYAGLVWFSEHAAEFGFDPNRILIVGGSAGGGLTAGTVLLARDRKGPAIAAQALLCPMLDDRNESLSARQFRDHGIWDGDSNEFGWHALLGDRAGTDDVSIYAAPGRAEDLSGLPPAYIDAGSAEVFRDEDIAYAQRIWAAGGQAELHIWSGGFHGFEVVPTALISQEAAQTRAVWISRYLGG